MKRPNSCIIALFIIGLSLFLCCMRDNPIAPLNSPYSIPSTSERVAPSTTLWPCSTEQQIDTAFANAQDGDTIYIYASGSPYSWTLKQFNSFNRSLSIIGEDTTVTLEKTAASLSTQYFFHFHDSLYNHGRYRIFLRNLKFTMSSAAGCCFMIINHDRATLENVVFDLNNGQQRLDFLVDTLYISNLRMKVVGTQPSRIINHLHSLFEIDFIWHIANSTFIQADALASNEFLYLYNSSEDGDILIEGCYFYDRDTTFATMANAAGAITNLTLRNNHLYDGRLRCDELAGGSEAFHIVYDYNDESIGACYEDVLESLCSDEESCPATVVISNWICNGVLYGREMFGNPIWSKNGIAHLTLEWTTTAPCRGFVEVFSGDGCGTAYTTAWDSTLSTSHSVTFDASQCNAYSSKLYALPEECNSLIAEGECHYYDPLAITFDDFIWFEDPEEGQLTLSWTTSDNCIGLARIYSGENCANFVASIWDSTLSTTHSVTFDAAYCVYSSARIYAQNPGCDSLISEGNCQSHYFQPDVQFSNISTSQNSQECTLTISWNTDVACKGRVFVYTGTSCSSAYGTYYDGNISTSHSITFSISPSTDYSWKLFAGFGTCYVSENVPNPCHRTKSSKCTMQR